MGKDEALSTDQFVKKLQEKTSFSEALGLTSDDLNQIAGLAAAFYQENKLESAQKLLEGLIALKPERAEYWSAFGAVLTRLEKHEEAVPALSAALKLNSKDTAALVNRGECYLALADNEKAAADFKEAIQLDPKQQDPASNRARQIAYGMSLFFEECHEAGLDTVEVDEEE
jgi:tetratricopeptide (TPR) repeat protein